ncbi:MAG: signal peptidase I [Limisphaerales bacterium]
MTPQNSVVSSKPRPGWIHVIAIGRNPKNTLVRILVLIVTCFVVFNFILLPIRVTGISMSPTYKDRSINFVNRLAYWRHEPRRGDVVSIRFAGMHVMLMKRIIGLPGETVAFDNGRVLIDGKILDEPYEKTECNWNLPPVKLDANEYYVVGDNRTMPPEYHTKGKVERERIIGKVIL